MKPIVCFKRYIVHYSYAQARRHNPLLKYQRLNHYATTTTQIIHVSVAWIVQIEAMRQLLIHSHIWFRARG